VIISYARIDDTSVSPERANTSDAGADIFACLTNDIQIEAGDGAVIPTGIKIEIPHGYMIQVMNRSSIASKLGFFKFDWVNFLCISSKDNTGGFAI